MKDAYHESCHACAAASVICAKCLLPWSPEESEDEEQEDRSAEVEEFCRDLNAKLLLEAEAVEGDRKESESAEVENDREEFAEAEEGSGSEKEIDSEFDSEFDTESGSESGSEFDSEESSKDFQPISDDERAAYSYSKTPLSYYRN